MTQFTAEEVARHSSPDDVWIIVDQKVYDVTTFLEKHPGGRKVLLKYAGKDASAEFAAFHKPSVLQEYGSGLFRGTLRSANAAAPGKHFPPACEVLTATPAPKADTALVPFADPYWYNPKYKSPYYKVRSLMTPAC
jgi:cytochrome b involved in lipid metabolism